MVSSASSSLLQALSSDGVVDTEDDRKKQLHRRYFLDIQLALGDARDQDMAVISIPEDGIVRENFGKDILLDVSTEAQQLKLGVMPFTAVFGPGGASSWMVRWLTAGDAEEMASRAGPWRL